MLDSMILFSQILNLVSTRDAHVHTDAPVVHLITDSRKTLATVGAVFFAIKGARHDGHRFIKHVYDSGVRHFVVEQPVSLPGDASYICVHSCVEVLQALATLRRRQFSIPVIGVTGSNGKTIVKEWLYQVLSQKFSIVKNPGSYNSQLGVPLSVWNMAPHHTLGIFEAGISQPNEMVRLEAIIQPTLGVFTNLGSSHNEGFESDEEKVAEKSRLFANSQLVVYCRDHALVHQALSRLGVRTLSWGMHASSDIVIKRGRAVEVAYNRQSFTLPMPFSDAASVENCMHCVAVMLHFQFAVEHIQQAVSQLRAVPMRLELKEGVRQSQVIDDSYNNDLAGLRTSLNFLSNQHQRKRRVLILSDIQQTGLSSAEWVRFVADLTLQAQVELFIGIGDELKSQSAFFPPSAKFYTTTREFLSALEEEDVANSTVLVKGARSFGFEQIVQRLQRKIHGTVMEIDLDAMVHNLNYFKAQLKPETKVMAMVKAFAYGSGSREVANLLQYHNVDYLGVAYTDEGVELRENNVRLPIMVMNPSPDAFENLITYQLEPEIYSFGLLHAFTQHLQGRTCTIHIKFDTGMHRLGFGEPDVAGLAAVLREHPAIRVASIFSHLAGADEAQHDEYSHRQAVQFERVATSLSEALGYRPLFHLLNSPGILRLPRYQFDMVRLGIGLYGIDPTGQVGSRLRPAATLKTVVSQVHVLPDGATVGYGRQGKISGKRKVATLAIGYADGYSRAFSRGVGSMLINGQRFPVLGNVCMDMTMVDVTGGDVKEGDEAEIFGKGMPIDQVASWINTISYEILTNTSERVKRVFTTESI